MTQFHVDIGTSQSYHALDSHILGFTLWEADHAVSKRDVAEFVTYLPRLSDDGYPNLAEHAAQHFAGIGQEEGELEFGLRLIIGGLRRLRAAG